MTEILPNFSFSKPIISKTFYNVIDILPEQKEKMAKNDYGGSMRLGAYKALVKKGTIAYSAYGKG